MTRVTQGAFNAGIISEGMYARSDTDKYQKGLRDAVNVLVRPQGGIANRAGFEAATKHDTSGATAYQYLIPFAFSTEQTYQLEFSDDVFRVIRDGSYVLDTSVGAVDLSAVTSDDPSELTLDDAGDAASFTTGCLAYINDPIGTHKLHNLIVQITGASGADLSFTVFDGTGLDTTSGDWGTLGAGAELWKVYEVEHTYDLADMPDVRYAQDADTMYLAHSSYPPRKIGRYDHDEWTITDVTFEPGIEQMPVRTADITGATKADPIVVTAPGHGFAAGDTVKIVDVGGMTEINDRLFTLTDVTTDTVSLMEVDGATVDGTETTSSWQNIPGTEGSQRKVVSSTYGTYTSGGQMISPGAVAAEIGADADLSNLTTYYYAVAPISEDTFEEGLPSPAIPIENDLYYKGSINHIGWAAVEGASRYAVYKQYAGVFGYIGTTIDTYMVDENITADTAVGVRIDRVPFAEEGEYPSVVSFYEQRLAFGASVNDPQLVEMSRVDNVENFTTSYPGQPDDALRFRLRDTRVNRVRAFVPTDSFTILTSGGEWEVAPTGDNTYTRPDKRKLAPQTSYGSYNIEPLWTGSVVLYVEPSGNVIRDKRPGDTSTPPGDLTVLAADLFEDRTIASWAYAASPDRCVWVALDDGTLLSMVYVPEHDVWGWTRHEVGGTDAKVRQVSVTKEGNRDVLYAVVSRTIGGTEVTMTERLADREDRDVTLAYFLDGGRKATFGSPVYEISGLLHLRGQSVVILGDGDVYSEVTVDETGTASLGSQAASQVSVGLSYTSMIQLLDVRFDTQQQGSSEGRFKSITEAAVKLKRSRGVDVGSDLARMDELKEWSPDYVGGPIPLRTHTALVSVNSDWLRDATLYVRQKYPLPMCVLGVSPEWEMGG